MDIETRNILATSIRDWCGDNRELIERIERFPLTGEFPAELFDQLNQLGILHVLGEGDGHDELNMVTSIAHHLALHSSSLAVMTVQQNLAARLLTDAQQPLPSQWVALPLFDAVAEWPHALTAQRSRKNLRVTGTWTHLPLLPVAHQVLLPLASATTDDFLLAALPLTPAHRGVRVSAPIMPLGLRGCPQADLHLDDVALADSAILLRGAAAFTRIDVLWSQVETCMMAIRAGIAKRSYNTARDYARQRYQGGKIIIQHSLIRKMLADFYREQILMDEGWQLLASHLQPGNKISHGQMGMALHSAERLPWLTSDGIQLLGGVGYMEDFGQERCYRDAKQCEFLLGHPQVRQFSLWQADAE